MSIAHNISTSPFHQAKLTSNRFGTTILLHADKRIQARCQMRKLAKTFKALSDETRLRILNILLERECCVCEVMQVLDITQSRASRHLITLCDAGFIKLRRQGLWAVYSIDWEGMNKNHIDLVATVREALMNNKTALLDKRKLSETVKVGLSGCSVSGVNSSREN